MVLELEKAALTKATFSPGRKSRVRVEISAMMTAKVAKDLDARWILFDGDQVIRGGFRNLELDTEFAIADVTHEIGRVSSFTMQGCSVSKFVAKSSKATKKKPKKISISFHLEYFGNNIFLMDHWNKVQNAEGNLRIVVTEQAKLDDNKTGGKKVDMSGGKQKELALAKPTAKAAVNSTVRFKCNDKSFAAALTVIETTDKGVTTFTANVDAKIGHVKIKDQLFGPHDSENAARQAGAKAIYDEAVQVVTKGTAAQKKLAAKMSDWATKYITADVLKDGSTVDGVVW